MDTKLHGILFLSLFLLLASCNRQGSGTSTSQNSGASYVDIVSYSVDGTSAPLIPGSPEPIDPYENEGGFTVNYEISSDGIVDVEFSLMNSDEDPSIFCGNESTEFFDRNCGADQSCLLNESISCKYESNYDISCTIGKKSNLTEFIDELPKRAQMVICTSINNSRTFKSVLVELR